MRNDSHRSGSFVTRRVVTAHPSLSIEEAARIMQNEHVGSLVIVEEVERDDQRVVGMLTDRDITLGVVAAQRSPQGMRVADLMSRSVVSAREGDLIDDVLELMQRKSVRRLPVLDAHDRLIGIVAADDILTHITQEMQAIASLMGAARRHEPLSDQGE